MTTEPKNRCARCGKRLKKGGLSYHLKAELISHFDGYIRVNPDDSITRMLEKINSEMESMTEDEIEKQVYQKFEYIICPACRDEVERFLQPEVHK
jgi:DNA-directed RNA polymerase subunit RPC12/RpoP